MKCRSLLLLSLLCPRRLALIQSFVNPVVGRSFGPHLATFVTMPDTEEPQAKKPKTEEAEEAGVKSEEAAAESSTEVLQNDEGNAYVELSSKKRCTIRKYRNVSNILDLSVLKEIRVFCLHHPLCDPTPDPAASRPCSSISERRTRRTARRFRERRVSA